LFHCGRIAYEERAAASSSPEATPGTGLRRSPALRPLRWRCAVRGKLYADRWSQRPAAL